VCVERVDERVSIDATVCVFLLLALPRLTSRHTIFSPLRMDRMSGLGGQYTTALPPQPLPQQQQEQVAEIFEGSNIHTDAAGRRLCSYSKRLCSKPRLEGYGFCKRHILEDPAAPFASCDFVSPTTHKRCTNPVPLADPAPRLCTAHQGAARRPRSSAAAPSVSLAAPAPTAAADTTAATASQQESSSPSSKAARHSGTGLLLLLGKHGIPHSASYIALIEEEKMRKRQLLEAAAATTTTNGAEADGGGDAADAAASGSGHKHHKKHHHHHHSDKHGKRQKRERDKEKERAKLKRRKVEEAVASPGSVAPPPPISAEQLQAPLTQEQFHQIHHALVTSHTPPPPQQQPPPPPAIVAEPERTLQKPKEEPVEAAGATTVPAPGQKPEPAAEEVSSSCPSSPESQEEIDRVNVDDVADLVPFPEEFFFSGEFLREHQRSEESCDGEQEEVFQNMTIMTNEELVRRRREKIVRLLRLYKVQLYRLRDILRVRHRRFFAQRERARSNAAAAIKEQQPSPGRPEPQHSSRHAKQDQPAPRIKLEERHSLPKACSVAGCSAQPLSSSAFCFNRKSLSLFFPQLSHFSTPNTQLSPPLFLLHRHPEGP